MARNHEWHAATATRQLGRSSSLQPACVSQSANFGLTFTPPASANEPWSIRTQWHEDEFMRLLVAIRPSLTSLMEILYYADAFIRSRPASVPSPGITFPAYTRDTMFTAPFISAPRESNAFLTAPSSSGPTAMDVDEDTSTSTPRRATQAQSAVPRNTEQTGSPSQPPSAT
jgi:hypothetical protein